MRHHILKNTMRRLSGIFNLGIGLKQFTPHSTFYTAKTKTSIIPDSTTCASYTNQMTVAFFSPQRFYNPGYKASLPKLPVLNTLLNKALPFIKTDNLKKTAIIYVHHPLLTSVNLIDAIIQLGAKPKNIFVLGKHYSECLSVVEQISQFGVHYETCSPQVGLGRFSHSFIRDINWLWKNVLTQVQKDKEIEEILILDHGGHALTFIPQQILQNYKVIGIEKTTGGLVNMEKQGFSPPFPIIGVANCAAKKILESPLIAEAVVKKLLPLIPIDSPNLICGVVGFGAIGKALTAKLLSMGHKVIVFDNNHQQLQDIKDRPDITITNELPTLIAFADYIFGCTGRDITTSHDALRLSPKNKTLISCSSEDIEFLSLLQTIQRKKKYDKLVTEPLADIEYKNDAGGYIRILRGGFPINFDNTGESVPAQDIQLTRALVLGAILQAIHFFKKSEILESSLIYSLDPIIQRFVVNEWIKYQPANRYPKNVIDSFQHLPWISEHSGGHHTRVYQENSITSNLASQPCLFHIKNKILIRHEDTIYPPNLSCTSK